MTMPRASRKLCKEVMLVVSVQEHRKLCRQPLSHVSGPPQGHSEFYIIHSSKNVGFKSFCIFTNTWWLSSLSYCRTFLSPQKRSPIHGSHSPFFSSSLPGNPSSFCVNGFAYSGQFIEVERYQTFVTLCDWLLSLSMFSMGLMACRDPSLHCCILFHCVALPHFVYPFIIMD